MHVPGDHALPAPQTRLARLLRHDAAGGALLVVATLIALAWANSPLHESYVALWTTPLGVSIGRFSFQQELRFWINEGVMTVFFFVVGLEIRREVARGELSEARRAVQGTRGREGARPGLRRTRM